MAYYLSVVGNWDAHIRNCEGLWSDAMHTRCFEVMFSCRSRNPPPSQLILVEGTPLQSLFRRLSARSSTLKVFLTRWIRTVSQNQPESMEQLPTMVPFILLVLMPTSNAFYLPGQRNHGERSDSQFCMTENNVSLNFQKQPAISVLLAGLQDRIEREQQWQPFARVRQHEHGGMLPEVPPCWLLHGVDLVE